MFLTKMDSKRTPVALAFLILLIALPGIGIQQGKATGNRPALDATQNDHSPGSTSRGMVFINTASADSWKTSEAVPQGANLVGHFLALGNSAGLDLAHVSSTQLNFIDITQSAGRTLPTLVLNGTNYFYAWQTVRDIEYAMLSYYGQFIKPVTKLTDNASATPQTFDGFPSNAATPNGRVGIVWTRLLIDPDLGTNYNVYFAVLDNSGNVLAGPINVTQNGPSCDLPEDCWQDGDDIDVPVFKSPAVLATSDNRFVISWIDERILPDGLNTDIGFAVYATNGNLLRDHDDLKNGNPGDTLFETPRLLELANQRVLVTYSLITQLSGVSVPHFGVYSIAPGTIGSEILEDVELVGAKSRNPDSVLLTNSKILVAWVNPDTDMVERTILDDNGGASVTFNSANLKSFQNPDNRSSDLGSVSLAATSDGMGIFSWRDGEGGNRLYYALVNSAGAVVIPPLNLWEDTQPVTISQNGQGIAPLPDWHIYMPVIGKQ